MNRNVVRLYVSGLAPASDKASAFNSCGAHAQNWTLANSLVSPTSPTGLVQGSLTTLLLRS
jgi:hypothetical protein